MPSIPLRRNKIEMIRKWCSAYQFQPTILNHSVLPKIEQSCDESLWVTHIYLTLLFKSFVKESYFSANLFLSTVWPYIPRVLLKETTGRKVCSLTTTGTGTGHTAKERCAARAGPAVRRRVSDTAWTLGIYCRPPGDWLLPFPLQKTHNGTLCFHLTSLENGNLSPYEKKNSKGVDERQKRRN